MLNQEELTKYLSILKKNNFTLDDISDIASAICASDILHGSNRLQLSYERFKSTLTGNRESHLPRVQILRVLCDSYLILFSIKGIDTKGLSLTIPSSKEVCKIVGVSLNSCEDYADEDTCIKVLEELSLSGCNEYDEVFSYISATFKRMKEYDENYKQVFSKYSYKDVYLLSQYNSYGFDVSTKITDRLKVASESELEGYIDVTFCSVFTEAFLQYCYMYDNTDSIARVGINRLISKFKNKGSNVIPIGIGGINSEVKPIKLPKFMNNAEKQHFDSVFTNDSYISRNTVSSIFKLLEL